MSQQEEERNTTSPLPDPGSDTSSPTFLKAARLPAHREASDEEDYSSPLREDLSQLTSLKESIVPEKVSGDEPEEMDGGNDDNDKEPNFTPTPSAATIVKMASFEADLQFLVTDVMNTGIHI
ncbi:hypothetical protein FRACYDRAFT_256888 [Fragilariopsis cylindrus CCMP1102]|uniref:Uncharacterized protein n=1 Tax=Fragilariopsis cylindrus CCMP1102 TaxID=635003 RepID=A0A1E7EJE8_9STRA|nr:hypothetical protein FRACYDRAFT_256888 [Fragilariopsis cylindrus CCMP1102]|eukprot:OEU06021.1 hypothetical protein FRACYDRAFT_256888 [Fragilariopsis cylindrus CCMP1102]